MDWGLYTPTSLVIEAFDIWLETEFKVLPYEGGWLSQPWYIRRDLRFLLRLYGHHEKRLKDSKPKPIQTLQSVFG